MKSTGSSPSLLKFSVARARSVGVSEDNLIGVVLEPDDLADERDYFMNRWPYLNEDKLSREAFL